MTYYTAFSEDYVTSGPVLICTYTNYALFANVYVVVQWRKISVGWVVYFTVLCDHPYLVSLFFAVLVSQYPVTFILFSLYSTTFIRLPVIFLSLQFRLSELERTVVLQLWNVVLANATVLAAFDYDVDDGLDIRPPGLFRVAAMNSGCHTIDLTSFSVSIIQ